MQTVNPFVSTWWLPITSYLWTLVLTEMLVHDHRYTWGLIDPTLPDCVNDPFYFLGLYRDGEVVVLLQVDLNTVTLKLRLSSQHVTQRIPWEGHERLLAKLRSYEGRLML